MSEDKQFWQHTSINIITNTVRTAITALIGIILVPYYIDTLGISAYGLIPLATAMTSYIMILSDSLVSACFRYIMVAFQKDDNIDEISSIYNTALFGVGKNLTLVIPAVVLFAIISPYVFNISDLAAFDVQMMFLLILLSGIVVTYCSALNTIFYAYNKLYILYLVRIVYVIVQVLLIILFFSAGTPSLIEIGLAYLISSLLFFVMINYCSRKICPFLKRDKSLYDPVLFKEMGALGSWTVVRNLGELLFIQMSLIITNVYLGSVIEGRFAIVVNIISMMNTACYSVVMVLSPLIFKGYSDGDPSFMVHIARTAMKLTAILFAMPMAYVVVFAPQILYAWVGDGYDDLALLIFIAYIAELAFIVVSVIKDIPGIYLKVNVTSIITLGSGALNIILAVIFLSFTNWGVVGVIIAWSVSTLLLKAIIAVYCAKLTRSNPLVFVIPTVEGYVAMAICLVSMYYVSKYIIVQSTWLSIIISFTVMFAIYVVAMFLVLRSDEKKMLMKVLPFSVSKHFPSLRE